MLPRWSNVLHRVTTAGPYANEKLSIVVLTSVIVAGIAAVAYADNSVTDGVVEAESPAGKEYSAPRMAAIVSSHLQRALMN